MNIEREPKEFISPVNWYLANILVRFEWYDEDIDNHKRRCLAWENTILIRANNPEEAYAKALEHGKQHEQNGEMWEVDNAERKGTWRFEGLTSLLAVYDEIEDGAEIMWSEHRNKSVQKVKSWVKPKEQLEAFGME